MSRYLLSPEARGDLHEIRAWLMEQAGLRVTRRIMKEIGNAMALLSRMPGTGHYRRDLTGDDVKFWQIYTSDRL